MSLHTLQRQNFLAIIITSEKRKYAQDAVDQAEQYGEYRHPGMPLERDCVDAALVHNGNRSSEEKAQEGKYPSPDYQGHAQKLEECYAL
jgi:hypothetical protein